MQIRSHKQPIAGYMGYTSTQKISQQQGIEEHLDSHIPGYVGYIPAVKSENLFANTYGKITENCAKHNYQKGIQFPPPIKYTSTTQQAYQDPTLIKERQNNQGRINGVKLSTFSTAARMMIQQAALKTKTKPKPSQNINFTYEQAQKQAYQISG